MTALEPMDPIEQHARRFLLSQFRELAFEPLGHSCPPDFLGDNKVGIEVRRLNQNFENGGKVTGLEKIERKLGDAMSDMLAEFGAPDSGQSWFVSYSFQRPLPNLKKLRALIKEALEGLPKNFRAEDFSSIQVHQNFKLLLSDAGVVLDQRFELGGYCDLDAGGWVQSELIRNMQICIDEKTEKMAAIAGVYDEWWLILVDHVSLAIGPSFLDVEFLRQHLTIPPLWDQVVLLSPSDHQRWNKL